MSRNPCIALVCGTAGLPHILVRFYTNPDGRAAKRTTLWVMVLLGAFYVLLWVGLVALSLLFGPVWRVISPVRTVYLLLRRITPQRLSRPRLSYPESWGYRPAALGLFVVNAMAVISYPDLAPAALKDHHLWGALAVALAVFGAGRLSVDAPLWRRLARRG